MTLPHWLRCKWPMWSDPVDGSIESRRGSIENIQIQIRICRVCNKRQARKVKFTN